MLRRAALVAALATMAFCDAWSAECPAPEACQPGFVREIAPGPAIELAMVSPVDGDCYCYVVDGGDPDEASLEVSATDCDAARCVSQDGQSEMVAPPFGDLSVAVGASVADGPNGADLLEDCELELVEDEPSRKRWLFRATVPGVWTVGFSADDQPGTDPLSADDPQAVEYAQIYVLAEGEEPPGEGDPGDGGGGDEGEGEGDDGDDDGDGLPGAGSGQPPDPPDEGARAGALAGLGAGNPASPSNDPVNLATGDNAYEPLPDLVAYNELGPDAVFSRAFYSYQAKQGYGSPGLSTGWVHGYDQQIQYSTMADEYGRYAMSLLYRNGAVDTMTASCADPYQWGQPAVYSVVSDPDRPYRVTATGQYVGELQTDIEEVLLHWADGTQWVFTDLPGTPTFPYETLVLSRIVDAAGRYIDLVWNEDRKLLRVDDQDGGALLTCLYDPEWPFNLFHVIDCDGRRRDYYYADIGTGLGAGWGPLARVTQITAGPGGNPPDHYEFGYTTYGDVDLLASVTVPSATGIGMATATFAYSSYGMLRSLTDANGNQTLFWYSGEVPDGGTAVVPSYQALVQVKDPQGAIDAWWYQHYDENLHNTGVTDALGHRFEIAYEQEFLPSWATQVTARDGKATTVAWDGAGWPSAITDPRGVTTSITWSQIAPNVLRPTAIREGDRAPYEFQYYANGLLQQASGPRPGGGLDRIYHQYTYDALGNVLTITGPGNNAATTVTHTLSYTSDGAYSQAAARGQPLVVTDPLGNSRHFRYDSAGRMVQAFDDLGDAVDYTYDGIGQLTQVQYPATGTTGPGRAHAAVAYLYNGGPVTTTAAYDESGNLVRSAGMTYGPEAEVLGNSGDVEQASVTYNAVYEVTSVTDARGQTTEYTHDVVGNITQVDLPGGDVLQYTAHDEVGRVLQAIDGNGTVANFTYGHAAGLLTSIAFPTAPAETVSLSYSTPYAELASVTDRSGSRAWTYDELGNVLASTTTYTGLPAKTLTYTYYANGQRAGLTTPGGSQSYLYDAAGHLLSHTTPLGTASWTYDALGRATAGILPNGARTTYAYGPGSVLATLTNQDPALATLSQFTNFTFNGQGQLTGFSAAVPGAPGLSGSQGWTYDILGRMQSDSSTRYGGWNDSYAYDELGNITNWRGAARTYNAANQETGAAFVYDGNGNPLTYKGETLTYNVFDGLTQYADDLTCGYRSDGLRAWKAPGGGLPPPPSPPPPGDPGGGGTTGGTTGRTYFLYDGPGIACELDATGAVTANLYWGHTGLYARGTTQYLFDPLSNTAHRLDAAGSVQNSPLYEAWGTERTTTAADPIGYKGQTGYYTDVETDLILCTWRYYDPSRGRWLNRDPIGYGGGLNLYGYCGADPVGAVDPLGLSYGQDVGQVFLGYGDTALGMAADAGMRSTLGIAYPLSQARRDLQAVRAKGFRGALAANARQMWHSLTAWATTNNPREFGQSFGAFMVTTGSVAGGFAKAPALAGGSAEVSATAPSNPAPGTLKANQAAHAAAVEARIAQLKSKGVEVLPRQCTNVGPDGTRCRTDLLCRRGPHVWQEDVKTGNGGLTPNQAAVYEAIRSGDATVQGGVAQSFGLEPGSPSPTAVVVRR